MQFLEILRHIGRAEDAERLHVRAEPAAVDRHGDASACARLPGTSSSGPRCAGEQLDLDLAVGPLERRIINGRRGVYDEDEVRRASSCPTLARQCCWPQIDFAVDLG